MPEKARKKEDSPGVGSFLFWVIVATATLVGGEMWLDAKVERSVPAGTVLRVSGAGGLHGRLLIETETAYYPVYDLLAVEKGTPLVLQQRANGGWYLCDARGEVCAATTDVTFKNALPKGPQ